MSDSERNPQGKSIRELAGTDKKFTMDSPEQKTAADVLLECAPAALAQKIVESRSAQEMELIRILVHRTILNPAQCALLSEDIANLLAPMKLIDAQRVRVRPLVESVTRHAAANVQKRLREILEPRLNEDGSLDVLA